MSHEKRASKSARRWTALASAVALALGTLSLAGCGDDDDELPPVEEESPITEEQGAPMQDTDEAAGADFEDEERVPEAEAEPDVLDDVAPEEDPLPEAEQEVAPDEQPEGQQETMGVNGSATDTSGSENDESASVNEEEDPSTLTSEEEREEG